jgi:hypothetical protein
MKPIRRADRFKYGDHGAVTYPHVSNDGVAMEEPTTLPATCVFCGATGKLTGDRPSADIRLWLRSKPTLLVYPVDRCSS